MTKLNNGDLLFPKRGNPPQNPDPNKYERDFYDPFIFHLKLTPCVNRKRIETLTRCGKVKIYNQCLYTKQAIDYIECELCTLDKEKLCL